MNCGGQQELLVEDTIELAQGAAQGLAGIFHSHDVGLGGLDRLFNLFRRDLRDKLGHYRFRLTRPNRLEGLLNVRIFDSLNFDRWQALLRESGQRLVHFTGRELLLDLFLDGHGLLQLLLENMGHYIENTGTTKLQFLELWKTDKVADVSLRQLLAFTPFELVQAHLRIDRSVLASIPTHKTPVVPA